MTTGFLLVSGDSYDGETSPELQKFDELLHNPDFFDRFEIKNIQPLSETYRRAPEIYFPVRKKGREGQNFSYIKGTLNLPFEPPVLIRKPGRIRPEYLSRLSNDVQASAPPVQFELAEAVEEETVEFYGSNITLTELRSRLEWRLNYGSTQHIPPQKAAGNEPAPYRVLRWYSFETSGDDRSNMAVERVLKGLADYVDALNAGAERDNKTPPFPTLKLDLKTQLNAVPGGQPSNVPTETEAFPEKGLKPEQYFTQERFKRIGLEVERNQGGNLISDTAGRPRFKVHRIARGRDTFIIIIDTSPVPGQAPSLQHGELSGVDWSSVEAVIDLHPEAYTQPSQNITPPLPRFKGVRYHGLMIANLCKLIAPEARIILVRALDDDGNGHTPEIIKIIRFLTRVVPGRKLGEFISGLADDLAEKVWIPAHNRLIFNTSWVIGGSKDEEVMASTLLYAIDDATLTPHPPVFVCAAGNDSRAGVAYNPDEPAAYGYFPGYDEVQYRQLVDTEPSEEPPSNGPLAYDPYNMVIGVASTAASARYLYAFYSNASPISAPSQNIFLDAGCELELPEMATSSVTGPNGTTQPQFVIEKGVFKGTGKKVPARFVCWSGTSFAAPLVTGQVALLLGQRRDGRLRVDPTEVKERIWLTANDPRWWNRPREINIPASL